MQKTNFPEGYQQVMPYLIIKDAAGFMQFMQEVFGAVEKMKHMRDEHTIMHAEVNVGESVIMFAESPDGESRCNGGFFIYVPDADATYKLALEKGATSLMDMSDQPYGRTGGIADPYGNHWWVTTHVDKK